MYSIKSISAMQIFDSRGGPTIETIVKTGFGNFKASVPSGASTGEREAIELRDGGKIFGGKGVLRAVDNVNEVLNVVVSGMDCRKQKEIDELMISEDNSFKKSKLGANSILSVSLAVAKAGAVAKNIELYDYISQISKRQSVMPVPVLNIINGGKHAGNSLDFQEYQIIPAKFKSFTDAFNAGVEVFQKLKQNLEKKYGKSSINVGDEGGFAPNLSKVEEPIDEILKAVEALGFSEEIFIGLDVAASSFYDSKSKKYIVEGKALGVDDLISEYDELLKCYPILSIEDPFDENDFESWKLINSKMGKKLQIVADDLTVSQKEYVEDSISKKQANTLLLKVNQVGTVTEAIDSAKTAFFAEWNVQVSHRSGETNDKFIADFAVGLGGGQIKAGAPCRGERLAKYNRLLEIDSKQKIPFIGKKAFKV
jgi:enolase